MKLETKHAIICLITSENMGEYGGIQTFTTEVSKYVAANGLQIQLISHKDSKFFVSSRHLISSKIVYGDFQSDHYGNKNLPLKSILNCIFSTFTLIKEHKNNQFFLIHAQDIFFSGLSGTLPSKLFRIPLIVHVHGPSPYFCKESNEASRLAKLLMRCLAKFVLKNATVVLTTDNYTQSLILPTFRKAKYKCLPSPINVSSFQSLSRDLRETGKGKIVFGFIGRLCGQKNISLLLRAFSMLTNDLNVHLVIAGTGPDKNALLNEARFLKITNKITFIERVDEETKHKLLRSFDVFVLPSIYEGCPISLLEAMACGKAIIASNLPSINQIVQHEKEALLIDSKNPEELKNAIERIVRNPELIVKLGHNSYKTAKSYDVKIVFNNLLEIYKSSIDR